MRSLTTTTEMSSRVAKDLFYMTRNSKAFTIEQLRAEFENQRWELLETVYRPKTPMKARCPEGHLTTKRSSDLRRGEITGKGLVCGICSPPGLRKLTIEFVREECKKRAGMTVLSTEYVDCGTPLEMLCPENHRIWKTWDSIKAGEGCRICSGSAKLTIDYIRLECEKRDFRLISTEYVNCGTPLEIECLEGHRTWKNWDSIKAGTKCVACIGRKKYTYEEVQKIFLDLGKTLLSAEYKNAHTPLEYWCHEGQHKHRMSLVGIWSGNVCGKCNRPEKTPLQIESQKIAINLTNALVQSLKGSKFNGSKRGFCNELADQVVMKLGPRPKPIDKEGGKIPYHLDHKIPRSWFNHTVQEQINLCWNVENLGWMLGPENNAKRDRLTKEMVLSLTPYQIAIANLAEFRPKRQENLMKKCGAWMTPKEAKKHLKKYQLPQGYAIQLELFPEYPIAS